MQTGNYILKSHMRNLKNLRIGNKELLPLIEGGKGISISTGESTGAWAAAGGIGTFSAVCSDPHTEDGSIIPQAFKGKTRRERHNELISYSIDGGISQARVAYERSNGQGRIHMNVLWEMGGVEPILNGILSEVKGMVSGITCGAGMPYKLAELSAHHGVHYYPIISSARAFKILWKRSYSRLPEWLGGVVYEDPWLAGGHNGLSNSEDPLVPEAPLPRVIELRRAMTECGLNHVPIIMAGGVWCLNEWTDWIDNPEVGLIAFQFGTRPLLTQESPISDAWKQKLLTLKEGDVYLNRFSPTGFYSSAVKNEFLLELTERSERQISFRTSPEGDHVHELPIGARGRIVYVEEKAKDLAMSWQQAGFTESLRTPDSTLVFVTPEKSNDIVSDQINCKGCLSACQFSNWSQGESGSIDRKADPRSFCIHKTLYSISHGGDLDAQLMFAGHQAFRFAKDPFYANGFIPTTQQLVERLLTGL